MVIVGAGAAGLMAAAELAAAGQPAVLIERSTRPGRKILLSGGGRCNFTHQAAPEEFLAAFPRAAGRFLKHAVHDLPPAALREWFAERGLESVAQSDGCVFPASGRSADVLGALLRTVQQGDVALRTGAACHDLIAKESRIVAVDTSEGQIEASAVVLATGSPAWTAPEETAFGYDLLRQAGHTVTPLRPGLAPLMVDEIWLCELQGISLPRARLTLYPRAPDVQDGRRRRKPVAIEGPVVFTPLGLSGPAALNASLHLGRLPAKAHLSLLADRTAEEIDAQLVAAAAGGGGQTVRNALSEALPRRVAERVLRLCGIDSGTRVGQLRRDQRRHLAEMLTGAEITIAGPTGWGEAMVAVGGCALGEIDPQTMESRRVQGLYVVGELLDVAGPTGGYNLHAAFATGRLAARAIMAGPSPIDGT